MRLAGDVFCCSMCKFHASRYSAKTSEKVKNFNEQSEYISSNASSAIRNFVLPSINFGATSSQRSIEEINSILEKDYGIKSTLTNPDSAGLFWKV